MERTHNFKREGFWEARKLTIAVMICGVVFFAGAQMVIAEENQSDNQCTRAVELLNSQKNEMGREFRQIKREMAVLKEAMGKPGISEILGGIGYIFGLFGVGYYWQARNLIRSKA